MMKRISMIFGLGILALLAGLLLGMGGRSAAGSLPDSGAARAESYPSPTPTSFRTLGRFNQLIQDEECVLPCWWGLELGESSPSDIKQLMDWLFGQESYRVYYEEHYTTYLGIIDGIPQDIDVGDDYRKDIVFGLIVNQESGKFVGATLSFFEPDLHLIDWTPYMPEMMIQRYGEPDEIRYRGAPTIPRSRYHANLPFRYHSEGLFINYEVYAILQEQSDNYTLCSSNDGWIISVDVLIMAEQPPSFDLGEEAEGVYSPFRLLRHGSEWEQDITTVTGLSVSEFVEQFAVPGGCVETLPEDSVERPE